MNKTIKARCLFLLNLALAMALTACNYNLPGELTLPAPTEINQPTEIPPTPTTGPQISLTPYQQFADLSAILGTHAIESQTYFEPGQTPWVVDPNVFILGITDDGTNNYAFACNVAESAVDDGRIDLDDYGLTPGEGGVISNCLLIASRPSSGTPYAHTYVIQRDGDRGGILNVELGPYHLHMVESTAANPERFSSGAAQCNGGVCVEPDAYVLEGKLEPVLP